MLRWAWVMMAAVMLAGLPVKMMSPWPWSTLGAAASAPTAPHPSVTLTCTAPASLPAGAYFNFYRGTTPGGEGSTPVLTNQTTCGGVDLGVAVNGAYYYTVKTCALSAATGLEVCSVASPESNKAIVPLLAGDLPAPGAPTGTGN